MKYPSKLTSQIKAFYTFIHSATLRNDKITILTLMIKQPGKISQRDFLPS
jgi:hypothetical protein